MIVRHALVVTACTAGLLSGCTASELPTVEADSAVVIDAAVAGVAEPGPSPAIRTADDGIPASPLPHPVEEKALRRSLAAAFIAGKTVDHVSEQAVVGVRHGRR